MATTIREDGLRLVTDENFLNRKDLRLEGTIYRDCTFEGCTMTFDGSARGWFEGGTDFGKVFTIAYEGCAQNTRLLMADLYYDGGFPIAAVLGPRPVTRARD